MSNSNSNPIITARLSNDSIQNFYTKIPGTNVPSGFVQAYDYCPVELTPQVFLGCGIALYTPSNTLPQASVDFLEKFYDVILTDDAGSETVVSLPKWVLVHKTHGVLGYWKPNLGKTVTRESHSFKWDQEAEATKYVAQHLIPAKQVVFVEGTPYQRFQAED